MKNTHIDLLTEFLNTPLDCGDLIFERFAALEGAVVGKGEKPLQRYVYVPGTRKDGVVLVAHTDTVWDKNYPAAFGGERGVEFSDGVFRSTNPKCGLGADDRAGCAMLFALRNSGHSLLIVDGEEKGKHGAKYLRKSNRKLLKELNRHYFMLELDWCGTNFCLYNQVDNTDKFKEYILSSIGFEDEKKDGGCDLQVLCARICGTNLGVGYHNHHRAGETLVLSEWENTLEKLNSFLAKPQTRFKCKIFPKYVRLAKRAVNKALRVLRFKK